MGRWGRKLFANYKRRGEWVELLFMTVASGLGFNVAKPFGDSARYDVIVENEGRFLRIQVKSTEAMVGVVTCASCMCAAIVSTHRKRSTILPSTFSQRMCGTSFRPRRWRDGGGRAGATSQGTQVQALHGKLVAADTAPLPTRGEDPRAGRGHTTERD